MADRNSSVPLAQTGLPPSERVDVACLARALAHKNTSYKFLLLKIILQRTAAQAAADELAISFDDIRREMLVAAWFPVRHFRLRFGTQDMLGRALGELVETELVGGGPYVRTEQVRRDFDAAAGEIAKVPNVRLLTHHPINVMLLPWFKSETKGLRSTPLYNRVVELSNERAAAERPPLYRIDRQRQLIVVHRRWREYFEINWQIINGWLDNQWLQFLTSQNPNVPNLANKLWEPPARRQPLTRQRNYWKPFIASSELCCFYSDSLLDLNGYHLDHFLPWSWVGHDQLWNLVPVAKEPNSSKSNRLPARDLIPALAERHRQAIAFARRRLDEHDWKLKVDDYIIGLNASYDDLLHSPNIVNAYNATIRAQLDLAERQGFETWENHHEHP
ncbi:MAG: hypothetical protein ISN26_06720 [Betaproteobacteria bacterium AqS2]|uniref:HNH nuclease domain-containing protein n=1 Tax=Candidatus Amphirhobacter heronislandensis TaxID=1732024 RepID=A0A930Y1V5_9GAMM|nr:hypothetical protein [Betaproteobacteria bacterium AqS2]